MDLLIEWVTQIIIFLLVASVVDLLIPETSLKKYINFTVGLILILIFLKPVFYLFDMDIKHAIEQSMTEVESQQNEMGETENLIKTQKKEIQASQHAYILEEMAVQLKELANDTLREEYHREITHIDFQISNTHDITYENLEENLDKLDVTLREAEPPEGSVDAVEDVVIMDEPSKNEAAVDVEGIKRLLEDLWKVDKDKISITGEGGSA
ncbi:stage III sporulation protein AF [Lentibacillus persicus]|uniref:Stage III sporulation protein AF n=1 Tax=Lentibacillus persicus TaxID=640948 RepID=A0A1I1T370_9BACI|nr:stage III sporulation protein AF [Lentibacillus persicus]SFD53086.1 stage III sporulation protein AF [Lentibacillus persicus]